MAASRRQGSHSDTTSSNPRAAVHAARELCLLWVGNGLAAFRCERQNNRLSRHLTMNGLGVEPVQPSSVIVIGDSQDQREHPL